MNKVCPKCAHRPWFDACTDACDKCGAILIEELAITHDPLTPEVLDKIMAEVNNVEPLPYGQTVGYNKGLLAMMRKKVGDIPISDMGHKIIEAYMFKDAVIGSCDPECTWQRFTKVISTRPPIWGF